MIKFVEVFISSIILSFSIIFVASKFIDVRIEKKKLLWMSVLALYFFASYILEINFIKIIFTFLILIFVIYKTFKISIYKAILTSFCNLALLLICEIICAILITSLLKTDMIFGNLITNLFIAALYVGSSYLNKIKDLARKIINLNWSKSRWSLYFFLATLLLVLVIHLYYVYFNIEVKYSAILCCLLIGFYLYVGLRLLKEKDNYNTLNEEYNTVLGCLKEYETLYVRERKAAHEFKNNLMIIRCMAKKESKKLLNYIDELSSNEKNYKFNALDTIPIKDLRGILYYKLLEMEKLQINYYIESLKVDWQKYNLLPDKLKIKIYKLLNIFLDNAIDAVKKEATKKINITICNEKEHIIFEVSNNFSGKIDFSKIKKEGFSSKGKNRGFGLSIAKDIINSDKKIINDTKINGEIFIQEIKIKM